MRLCDVHDCDRKHWGRGFCQAHYTRLLRHGNPNAESPVKIKGSNGSVCDVHACEKPPHAHRLCRGHLERSIDWGDVRADLPLGPSRVLDPCQADGCGQRHYAKGYCRTHWRRLYEWGRLDVLPPALPRACSVVTCGRTVRVRGFCNTHYERLRRTGSTQPSRPIATPRGGACLLDRCERAHYCLGYCQVHYVQRVAGPRRRALEAAASGVVTAEQLNARVAYYGHRCWMCGAPWTCIDHVKPLAAGGSNWPANLRPACQSCNARKSANWFGVARLQEVA